jgi:hypothetical protein
MQLCTTSVTDAVVLQWLEADGLFEEVAGFV